MGDAAGIGPEIILKSLSDNQIFKVCRPVVIGDAAVLRRTARDLGLDIDFITVEKGGVLPSDPEKFVVYDLANVGPDFRPGVESAATGKASAEYVEEAVRLWYVEELDAIATAPISKLAINLGGYDFPGHTEFLAFLTDTEEFAMSFFADRLRVVLLSTHIALRDALELVKKERLVELFRFTHREVSALLKREARIAVAGLNPHASEGGMFGREEADEIAPAVNECREFYGLDITGPFSPDTIFLRAFKGEFDAVVACYHDQATIAVKCLSFGASVNVTLGLPLIRTSVDHGTAFDIAGQNLAESSSMTAAIKLAAELSLNS
ncbi:MAG: 4-hydroxythreonine-4-phosphate dehydrogenase PdxA [Acidobacteria bacterium]|nr:4-hydroxythreonine-4-phosphate dehydrogenase PdxA [Acidobacteriota bacterium]